MAELSNTKQVSAIYFWKYFPSAPKDQSRYKKPIITENMTESYYYGDWKKANNYTKDAPDLSLDDKEKIFAVAGTKEPSLFEKYDGNSVLFWKEAQRIYNKYNKVLDAEYNTPVVIPSVGNTSSSVTQAMAQNQPTFIPNKVASASNLIPDKNPAQSKNIIYIIAAVVVVLILIAVAFLMTKK